MEEIWKDIPSYEGHYQASDLGNIRSVGRFVNQGDRIVYLKGKEIKQTLEKKSGYVYLSLSKNGKITNKRTHVLIALTFIANVVNKPQVNHKNGVRNDNRLDNLEWNTRSENIRHSFDNLGRKAPGAKPILDTQTGIFYESLRDAAEAKGVSYEYFRNRKHRHKFLNSKGLIYA